MYRVYMPAGALFSGCSALIEAVGGGYLLGIGAYQAVGPYRQDESQKRCYYHGTPAYRTIDYGIAKDGTDCGNGKDEEYFNKAEATLQAEVLEAEDGDER